MAYRYLVAGLVIEVSEPLCGRRYRGRRRTEARILIRRGPRRQMKWTVNKSRAEIFCPRTFGHDDLRELILYKVIPRLLAAQGRWVIHASGVSRGQQAVVFAGLSGSGKSTLAFHLKKLGHSLLSDEALVIEARPGLLVVRSYPQELRLKNPQGRVPIRASGSRLFYLSQIFLMHPDAKSVAKDTGNLLRLLLQSSFPVDSRSQKSVYEILTEAIVRNKVSPLPFPKNRSRARRTHNLILNLLKSQTA